MRRARAAIVTAVLAVILGLAPPASFRGSAADHVAPPGAANGGATPAADGRTDTQARDAVEQADHDAAPAPQHPIIPLPLLPVTHAFADYGFNVGAGALAVNPVTHEVIVGGSRDAAWRMEYWQVLRWNAATHAFVQRFVSAPRRPRNVLVANVMGTDDPEIMEVYGGWLRVLDGSTMKLLFSTRRMPSIEGVVTANMVGDAHEEIVGQTGDGISAFDGRGKVRWHMTLDTGGSFVIGQMDDDPSLEIATRYGYILDVATRKVQSTWMGGFGDALMAADIDGDHRDELLWREPGLIRAFDPDTQSTVWTVASSDPSDVVKIADADGDLANELLLGDSSWGGIRAFDIVTGTEKWSLSSPRPEITAIAVGDTNGDGSNELLWGGGFGSDGSRLFVADGASRSVEWESPDFGGWFVKPAVGTFESPDEPGVTEKRIVTAGRGSRQGIGGVSRFVMLDTSTFAPVAMSAPMPDVYSYALRVADLDRDGVDEIVFAIRPPDTGITWLEAWAFRTGTGFVRAWQSPPVDAYFQTLGSGDLDGDGRAEVLAGACDLGVCSLEVRRPDTGELLWSIERLPGSILGIEVAQLDADPAAEIAVLLENGLWIIDGTTHDFEVGIPVKGRFLFMAPAAKGQPAGLSVVTTKGKLDTYRFTRGAYRKTESRRLVFWDFDGIALGPGQVTWAGQYRQVVRWKGSRRTAQSEWHDLGFGYYLLPVDIGGVPSIVAWENYGLFVLPQKPDR